MHNKLWYIDQDVTSTVYRATIDTASDSFTHSVTGLSLHHLWHHRLCHAGKIIMDNIAKAIDGVPSLKKRNTFFSCGDCSSAKMTDQIKGYNNIPIEPQNKEVDSTWITVSFAVWLQLKTKMAHCSLAKTDLIATY